MAELSMWEVGRDLVIACLPVAGYAWLVALSVRMRVLHRHLAMHVCRDVGRRADGRRCSRMPIAGRRAWWRTESASGVAVRVCGDAERGKTRSSHGRVSSCADRLTYRRSPRPRR